MKKLILLPLIFFCILSYAQNGDFNYLNVRNAIGPPLNDTIANPYKLGEIRTRPQDSISYRYNGKPTGSKRWDRLYYGSSYLIPTLDQVLSQGNVSGQSINVSIGTFAGVKIPSLGQSG